MSMRRIVSVSVAIVVFAITVKAQNNSDRLSLGVGCLYQNGLDLTLSYEHEGKYHHAWEFFANAYIKWAECASCKHICPESFWKNYHSYGFGVAYKPCVVRGAIITAMSVSVRRQEVIPIVSWEVSTSDMSTIMYCVVAGSCSARSRPI